MMSFDPVSYAMGAKSGGGGGSTGGGVLVVHVDENDTLDKTWQEIHDAIAAETIVVAFTSSTARYNFLFSAYWYDNDGTRYYEVDGLEDQAYIATAADGYPVFD